VNNCDDAVWTVVTPPGAPQQVAVAGQWDGIKRLLCENFTVNGAGEPEFVGGSNLSVPNCTYKSAGDKVCPGGSRGGAAANSLR
jgi:hypothetical protein